MKTHEDYELNGRRVAMLAVSLVFLAIIMHLSLGWGLHWLKHHPFQARGRIEESIALERSLPPPPRLETHELHGDYEQYRARELMRLNSYGWVNRQAGIARIPIERAMEIYASK